MVHMLVRSPHVFHLDPHSRVKDYKFDNPAGPPDRQAVYSFSHNSNKCFQAAGSRPEAPGSWAGSR